MEQSINATEVAEGGEGVTSKKGLKKLEKEREKERKKQERLAKEAAEKQAREASQVDCSKSSYGKLPLIQSQTRTGAKRESISGLNASRLGEQVLLRARIQTSRPVGSKLCFFILRQRNDTAQAVIIADDVAISKQMVKFAINIPSESIVLVQAEIVVPSEEIKACTVHDVELRIQQLFIESEAVDRIPFSLENATLPEPDHQEQVTEDSTTAAVTTGGEPKMARVALATRLDNRVMDLRTITGQAIFRIQSGVCNLFREFLIKKDFVEIHSPKIIGAASEGGASVFEVKYFKTSAYLAQSPQFYKQMAICADFERVFEIGPVFRAEDANTHRHLTEFVGLDLEMAFQEHYHEVLDLLDELFVFVFAGLAERYKREIEVVKRQFPAADFRFLPKSLRLTFREAVSMLREAGVEIGDFEDLNTAKEKMLGKLVAEKYGTDFFILDKFPLAVRPFYTMPDPHDANYSNSYDFFMRGEEIMSGAQRVHEAGLLESRAKELGVEPNSIKGYLDAFRYGTPPHAGGGIGLERVVMLYLALGNIRRTSMFPRDPKRLEP